MLFCTYYGHAMDILCLKNMDNLKNIIYCTVKLLLNLASKKRWPWNSPRCRIENDTAWINQPENYIIIII